MPGVRTDLPGVDYYIVRCDRWDMDGYIRSKGDPARCIGHFRQESDDLEPMWGAKGLKRRVDLMKDRGVSRAVCMDFSTFLEWPVAIRIWNIYRAAVVNNSMMDLGIQMLAAPPCLSCLPEHHDLHLGMLPDTLDGPVLLDVGTLRNLEINDRLWRASAEYLRKKWPTLCEQGQIWLWGASPLYARWWSTNIGPCQWVKSRAYMQSRVVRHRERIRK